jgi:ribosomal protein L3 glutamine methyltransferase
MSGPKPRAKPISVGELIERSARRLVRARVFFGHGTDNAFDDAAALVLHALSLPHDAGPGQYRKRVSAAALVRAEALIARRIDERIPAVYLTGLTWFAGFPFHVDPRVLIPRSPLAEIIEARFEPWIDPRKVGRVLDVGTGSGCIAIACAKVFPRARVDAVDISDSALEVAKLNVRRHRLGRRVRLIKSDHFMGLAGKSHAFSPRAKSAAGRFSQSEQTQVSYDIIVANPPYVGAREMKSLPPEYRHEPRMALAAGAAGLDSVKIILKEAGLHLNPRGILVVEVGNTEAAVRRAYRDLPFMWLEFERGGGGVFLLTAEQLRSAA